MSQITIPLPRFANVSMLELSRQMLYHIGEDPTREGLLKTPERFQKAFQEMTSGYQMTAEEAVGEGVFESESSAPVTVKQIEFYSLCEHHLLPFWGHVSIAYLPGEKILGLSKLARVVDVYARRLQVQERLTREIADSIHKIVNAKAVAVSMEAQHMCMMMRGVGKQGSSTRTEYMVGGEALNEYEKQRLWKQLEK